MEIAYGLPGSQSADDETVSVGVDDVHIIRIRLVQPNFWGVALKKRTSRVETCRENVQSPFLYQNPPVPPPVILLRFLNSFPTKPDT